MSRSRIPAPPRLVRAGSAVTPDRLRILVAFGAAILISLIDAGAQALASSSSSGSGGVVISPSRSTDVLTEILRSTLAIPPTITIPQGARVQMLVARDVDFRSVYALKTRE